MVSTNPGVDITLPDSAVGFRYQLQVSEDLMQWRNAGEPVMSQGGSLEWQHALGDERFFRIQLLP